MTYLISANQLQNESDFEKTMKSLLTKPQKEFPMIWVQDGKGGFKATLVDGSYIRLKFFDCIVRLKSVKGLELPGKESSLSYINVSVMLVGIKGYQFNLEENRYLWKFAPADALAKHALALESLKTKAQNLGIDLDVKDAWETYYVGR